MSRTIRPAVLSLALLSFLGFSALALRAQQRPAGSGFSRIALQQAQQAKPAQPQKPGTDPQAQGQQQQQQPTFRLPINFVRVDVIVNDKQGNAVDNLKPGDFEVTEDGKPQKVESFKFINIGGATEQQLASDEPPREIRSDADEEAEAARDDVRIFAIFLDDYHVRLGSSMAVRAPLERFLSTQLGPNDLVEIMYPLTPVSGLLLTRDHDKIARAIETFVGRKYDYRPLNEIEEQYANYPAQAIEQIRNNVSLSALKGLVTHLGGLSEKRKSVILVSEGYTALLPPQLRDPVASMPGLGNPNRYDPNAGDNPAEQRANFFASADITDDLRNVFDAANRANTAIYTLDPRGLATGEFDLSQPAISQRTDYNYLESSLDALRVLSNNTDAKAIVNRNDLAGGLKQILRDSSAYYLLGYNSTLTAADGRFHEIKVKVNRPGVQVRARKGYWAPTEEDRAKAMAPARPAAPPGVTNALASIATPPGRRVIRTWIGTSRGDNGKTRVTFVWEPVPPPPGSTDAERPARVSLIAGTAKGDAYFRGQVPDGAVPAAAPASQAAGAASAAQGPVKVTFDVPPGKLQLRMSVEGSASQVLDTDVREVDVPDLTMPQVMLTTPAVYSARTAREFRTLSSDANAVPTPDREFSRTERLLIRFGAYGPGNTTPTITVNLLSRGGQPMSKLTAQPGAASPQEQTIDLPLAGLASGEYVIEIKAKGESGEATEMVAIRVTA
jgi:VWFA-related protein